MADFQIALASLLSDEGIYVNNPVDGGGETVYGISRRWQPTWAGWQFIDALTKLHSNIVELNHAIAADADIQTAVSAFYRQKFWNFDTIPSQVVANRLLSMEVNFGPGTAVRILQQGLNRLGHAISVDGSLGTQTLSILADTKEPDLMHALRAYAVLYRFHRVQAQPDQIQFLDGWIWRDTA